MRAWLIAAVAVSACAAPSKRLASEADFVEASSVEYEASFDEVYDAAWLSLEKLGLQVASHDRRQGTFSAGPKDGDGYDVQVAPRELKARLSLSPRRFEGGRPVLREVDWRADQQGAQERIAALHAQVKALAQAWRQPVELDYAPVGHVVGADGVRLPLPQSWNVLELRTDRRRLKLQLFKRATLGQNPTLLVELDRRRPAPVVTALFQTLTQEAAQSAVPDAKLVVPEREERDPQLLSGGLPAWTQSFELAAEPFDLDLHTFLAETHAWSLRAAAACPRPATPDNAPDAGCLAAVKSAFGRARTAARE